ncbi:MAG: autotransporter domain-containing protein [Endomicrobium sp.]|nr:autotransporter domain-containing protein [Endomicrobium sp.]
MKKNLVRRTFIAVLIITAVFFAGNLYAVSVSNFQELKNLYNSQSQSQQTAVLSNDISAGSGDRLSTSYADLDLSVNLNGKLLSFSNNTYSGMGGSVCFTGKNLRFFSGDLSFTNISSSHSYGGAVFNAVGSNMSFENCRALFSNNTNGLYGGAIENFGKMIFSGGSAVFSGNQSSMGGALESWDQSSSYFPTAEILFNSIRVEFFGNNANDGGAVSNFSGSLIDFNGSVVVFTSNSATYGGAIYNALGSTLTFRNSNVTFSGNSADRGSAIYNSDGRLSFTGGTTVFSNSTGDYIIYSDGGEVIFSGGKVVFSDNLEPYEFIESYYSDIFTFDPEEVNFLNNSAVNGGAGMIDIKSVMYSNFGSGLKIKAFGNSASDSGGFLFLNADNLSFNGKVEIGSNSAANFGGAFDVSASTLSFNNAQTLFGANSAQRGSVFYALNSVINFNGGVTEFSNNLAFGTDKSMIYASGQSEVNFNGGTVIFSNHNGSFKLINDESALNFNPSEIHFISNTNNGDGGADMQGADSFLFNKFENGLKVKAIGNKTYGDGGFLYLKNKSVKFNADLQISNNSADGKGGAFYISGGSLTFNSDNADIVFNANSAGGVPNDIYMADNSFLIVEGSKNIKFGGGILSDASAASLAAFKYGSGSVELCGVNEIWGNFEIAQGTVLLSAEASYKGKNLKIDSAGVLDMQNDFVNTVNTADFDSLGGVKMEVFSDSRADKIISQTAHISGGSAEIKAGFGIYNEKRFDLITASSLLSGAGFDSVVLNTPLLSYSIQYDSNAAYLIINGTYSSGFEYLDGLSYNQSQTAKALDAISLKESGDISDIIRRISDMDDNSQKEALTQMSGYFLSNAIKSAASENLSVMIYDKMVNYIEKDVTNKGFWTHIQGGYFSYSQDENSAGTYKSSFIGAAAGYNMYVEDKGVLYGFLIKFNRDSSSQLESRSDSNKAGAGLYGIYSFGNKEIKAIVSAGYDLFNNQRNVMEKTAESSFGAFLLNADFEAALQYALAYDVKLKPYVGIEASSIQYDAFKEKNAGGYNLEVKGGNYARAKGRIGVLAEIAVLDNYSFSAGAQAHYLAAGAENEIESSFESTPELFKSKGAKEGEVGFSLSAATEGKINDSWKIFVNAKYETAQNYSAIFGNLGIRYSY